MESDNNISVYVSGEVRTSHAVHWHEVVSWFRSPRVLLRLFRFDRAVALVDSRQPLPRPLVVKSILWLLSRRLELFESDTGKHTVVDLFDVMREAWRFLSDLVLVVPMLVTSRRTISRLDQLEPVGFDRETTYRNWLYLRLDLSFGVSQGGSIAHIQGVISGLLGKDCMVQFVTTDWQSPIDAGHSVHLGSTRRFWNFRELPSIANNTVATSEVMLKGLPADVIYQRYSAYNYVGITLSQKLNVPLILEYNGSEVWINANWGRRLRYERLALAIEDLNLRLASLIVVVSEALRRELLERGVSPARVVTLPNGVDVDVYRPDVPIDKGIFEAVEDGEVRIGFIGTFGKWHGVEVLAHAFDQMMEQHPDLQHKVRMYLVGDGISGDMVRRIVEGGRFGNRVSFCGLVAQQRGPGFLSGCDILVSPQLENPDGSEFFGSPTKLFEYMASGRAIVASGVGQIKSVIRDGENGLVVSPGDVGALADALARLAGDSELRRVLGKNARQDAIHKHTWASRVESLIERMAANQCENCFPE